ncbi:MAG: urea transport system ATP-binding protein [Cellvibrionaceae bacterium]|jgi:urea transport system ATP-binding protein
MVTLNDTRKFWRRDKVWSFLQSEDQFRVNVDKDIILYVEGLSVSFDGFKALNDLNLYINEGELRCIIGANGAGKTTFMDVITGKTRCDSGAAYFGQTINLLNKSESAAARLGIGRKFQKPSVFEALDVYANLELAVKTHTVYLAGKA